MSGEVFLCRIRAVQGELERFGDLTCDLRIDSCDRLILEQPLASEEMLEERNRIERLPVFAFREVTIARVRVVAGAAMRTQAIDGGLDKRWTSAGSRSRHGVCGRIVDREDVDAIYRHRGHLIRGRPAVQISRRLPRRKRRLDRVEI